MKTISLLVTTLLATTAHAADTTTLAVTVAGAPNAGAYKTSSEKGACSYGLVGPDSFGVQLSSTKDKDPKNLNSMQMIVPSTSKAKAGTEEFFLSIGFGPLSNRSATYGVETRASSPSTRAGSGTVTINDTGTTATVKFRMQTAGGAKVEGTLECKNVMRMGKK